MPRHFLLPAFAFVLLQQVCPQAERHTACTELVEAESASEGERNVL
jgi:hypothetical protein